MFFGKYSQTLDEKNRLRIPKEFRNKLGNEIVIGRGLYGCLFIYPSETFDKLYDELYEIDTFDAKKQQAMTTFLSSYYAPEIDSQGRIIIPKDLKARANITKNVVTRGGRNRIEVWDEETLRKAEEEVEPDIIEILSKKD